jgi:uncharacterized membrane protein YhdT
MVTWCLGGENTKSSSGVHDFQTGWFILREVSLPVVLIIQNTQIHCVDRS